MNKWFKAFMITFLLGLILTGCAHKKPSQEYLAYAAAMQKAAQTKGPLLKLTWYEDGRIAGLEMNQQQTPVKIEQYRKQYHPAWKMTGDVLRAAIPFAGYMGTAWATGNALEGILKAGNGPITVGSHNKAGSDMNYAIDRSTVNWSNTETVDSNNPDYSVTSLGETSTEGIGELSVKDDSSEAPIDPETPADSVSSLKAVSEIE